MPPVLNADGEKISGVYVPDGSHGVARTPVRTLQKLLPRG